MNSEKCLFKSVMLTLVAARFNGYLDLFILKIGSPR